MPRIAISYHIHLSIIERKRDYSWLYTGWIREDSSIQLTGRNLPCRLLYYVGRNLWLPEYPNSDCIWLDATAVQPTISCLAPLTFILKERARVLTGPPTALISAVGRKKTELTFQSPKDSSARFIKGQLPCAPLTDAPPPPLYKWI